MINIVFSFDSILTAVGMTNGTDGALVVMIIAVVASVAIMMLFAQPVSKFVNDHPSIQMLIAEGAHDAHFEILGSGIGAIPKGYLYFAIAFSLFVEFLNIKMRKKGKPVVLHNHLKKENELPRDH